MSDFEMAVDRTVETREFKSGKLYALPIKDRIDQDKDNLFYTIANNLPVSSVIDSMSEPILLVAQNRQVTMANSAAIDFFDLPQTYPLPPISYPDLIRQVSPELNQQHLAEMPVNRALQGETLSCVQLVLKLARQASTVVEMSAAPVRDEQGEIICAILVIRDITERVCFDRAKDEFLSVASHELRNPLAVAQGLIQLIKMRFKRRTEIAEQLGEPGLDQISVRHPELFDYRKDLKQLDSVLRNINQMSRVISDLMDVTKIETGHLQINNQPINLIELTEEITRRIQATNTKHQLQNITDLNQFVNHECWVFGDYLRLEQVLVNLLTNAIKYSSPGQAILVRVETSDKWAVVSVKDFGIGIPKQDQSCLFQRSFRASNVDRLQKNGLGLGLFISANIVREHGGHIWVESEPGCGSTFYFSLPLDDDRLTESRH